MGLIHYYSRLNLNLAALMMVTLLERHAKGLDTLSEQFSDLLRGYAAEPAYREAMLQDYNEMIQEELYLECSPEQLLLELNRLITELHRATQRRHALGTPRAVYFEFPDTLVLEYPSAGKLRQLPKQFNYVTRKKRT